MKRRNLQFWTTGAAVLSSGWGGVDAWVPPASTTSSSRGLSTASGPLTVRQPNFIASRNRDNPRQPYYYGYVHSPQGSGDGRRLYSSSKNNEEGILSKIGKAAKKFLPTTIFGTEEEKTKLARKKEYRDQVSGGLDSMLKDAPLALRMMGKLVSPLVSSMASTLADTMAEQQRTTEGVMDDARSYLMGDPSVSQLLGGSIQLGPPFSQSSSSSNINGQMNTRLELVMPVQGSKGSGTVRLLATQDGISQLQLEAGGRRLDVSLTKRGSPSSSPRSSLSSRINGDDNIIEAEVIDKETK